ncbi:helix-turn-helix domain-containing protein [Flectobacillus rivi]|uniref:AraC family transcriptional regulator n=1 Tax=Flectobacillus rivi TaxID=2984209 RepID=A0ABT6YVN3_9BACT|nr:AraC family transcriptional regulator [Flectobacillus rivi]MDI9872940.1 AraC family transcriptional regulator [Flectobacillus rivi]
MEKIIKFDTVKQYNEHERVETLHPLVSVVKFDETPKLLKLRAYFGLYAIFLKLEKCGDMTYGCQPYDYDDGTAVFVGPGQIYAVDGGKDLVVSKGYGLVFHPDLLKGTNLAKVIRDYSFFSYEANEALHLSQKERNSLVEILKKITEEISLNLDKHSKTLIVSNIELLLNYCMRYYDRQFITRSNVNKDLLVRFENLLKNYFESDIAENLGLPSVSWCASELNLSTNYFGDLIKKETGITALDYIQSKVINEAKIRIFDKEKSLNEIANSLGFKYQQHFTRLFKQKTGITPNEFRGSLN